MDFGEHEPQLATTVEEQLLVQSAAQNERRGHLPISDDLTKPCVLLRTSWRIDHLDNLIGATRPPSRKPGARFTHFSFAAQIVKLHNDARVICVRFIRHIPPLTGRTSVLTRTRLSAWWLSILIRPLVITLLVWTCNHWPGF